MFRTWIAVVTQSLWEICSTVSSNAIATHRLMYGTQRQNGRGTWNKFALTFSYTLTVPYTFVTVIMWSASFENAFFSHSHSSVAAVMKNVCCNRLLFVFVEEADAMLPAAAQEINPETVSVYPSESHPKCHWTNPQMDEQTHLSHFYCVIRVGHISVSAFTVVTCYISIPCTNWTVTLWTIIQMV